MKRAVSPLCYSWQTRQPNIIVRKYHIKPKLRDAVNPNCAKISKVTDVEAGYGG